MRHEIESSSVSNSPFHLVVSVSTDRCFVEVDGSVVSSPLPDAKRVGRVAVGDFVRLADAAKTHRIVEIAARRSVLSRPDPHRGACELIVAANVDVVVIVVSIVAPPLKPRLVDRYWVAAQRGGAEPLLVVNKIDLAGGTREEALSPIAPHRDAGLTTLAVCTTTAEGIADLLAAIGTRTAVFVGHSGVGKSSIVNAITEPMRAATGAVSAANHKGRHTTTSSSVHRLSTGAVVIDTPGIRSFGLWAIDARSLAAYFPDFASHAASCRFSDCAHAGEPRCAVADAAARGELHPARYDTYRRLLDSLAERD